MTEHIAGRARGIDKLDVIEEHLHGTSLVYPDLDDAVSITCGTASTWDLGTIVEIIPANTIIKDFDIHWVSISAISANDEFQLNLYSGGAGSEVLISAIDFYRDTVQAQEGSVPTITPIIKKNTRISVAGACLGGTAKTFKVKIRYHVY